MADEPTRPDAGIPPSSAGARPPRTPDDEGLPTDQPADTAPDEAPESPFGQLGQPLHRSSPFYVGFFGGLGVLLAYFLTMAVVDARSVLVLVAIALFLAVGLNPIIERLVRTGMRRPVAVAVVSVGFLLAFTGFTLAIVPPVVEQTNEFIQNVPDYLDELQENDTVQELDAEYEIIDRVRDYVTEGGLAEQAFGGILGVGRIVLNAVFGALTVLILTLYFLVSLPSITEQFYRLFPRSRRDRVRLLGNEMLARVGGYVSGAFVIALIAFSASLVFLTLIGLDFALALSLFVGLMSLVPMVGATIAAIIVTSVALFDSVGTGVIVIVYYTLYQQVENYLIYPRIMRRAVDVPPAVTIIAALLGGALFGMVGALIAIPSSAAILLFIREVVMRRQDAT